MTRTGIAGFAVVLALGLGVSTAASQQAAGTISGKATDEVRQPYTDYAVQLRDVSTGQVTMTRPLDQKGMFSFAEVALTRPYLVELFHTKERRVICTEGPYTLTTTQTVKSDVNIACGKAPAALWVLLAGAGAAAAIAVAARSVSR